MLLILSFLWTEGEKKLISIVRRDCGLREKKLISIVRRDCLATPTRHVEGELISA
jgi:hypothetical protein